VNFQIKFNATNFVTKDKQSTQIVSYTIEDTSSGLAINEGSVNVKVAGADITANVQKTFVNGKMTLVLSWADASKKSIYNSPSEVI
ncbi:SpaH/EbpB family LPXTG-anchored major pilin, partial [Streptococcus pyogenes]